MGVTMHEALPPTPAGAGYEKLRPKPGRKPLQPRNSVATLPSGDQPKPKPKRIGFGVGVGAEISPAFPDLGKENRPHPPPPQPPSRGAAAPPPPARVEQLDASLAEELVAVRKKLERLRADRERTEAMLKERDGFLAAKMREVEEKGEVQKLLEIEVDRLYRLKQLKLSLAVSALGTDDVDGVFALDFLCGDSLAEEVWGFSCLLFVESESLADPIAEGEVSHQSGMDELPFSN